MSYRKIVQVGASGNLGAPIFNVLVDSGRFEVTVLGRKSSSFVPPSPDVKFFGVDYSNHAELVEALRGQDAIIMTQGNLSAAESVTKNVVNAAIEAGVKHIIPSLFGASVYFLWSFFSIHVAFLGIFPAHRLLSKTSFARL